jgi:hypothetical protein
MAYVLIFIGLLLTVAGVRNTQDDLYTLIQGDFTGSSSFIYWLAAIAIVGGVGYVPKLKPLSNAFLVLILIVLVLKQGTGFFDQFSTALKQSTATQATGTNG